MSPSLTSGLIAVAIVLVVGALMRRGSSSSDAPMAPRRSPEEGEGGVATMEPSSAEVLEDEDDDEDDPHVAAVTSDGEAFVSYQHAVIMIPPEESGEQWKVGAGLKSVDTRGALALGMSWQAGEMTGMRVVRGGADEGPWRLEGLGRDGEYTTFSFETRDGAEAAKKLFETMGVVKLGEDEDGNRVPPSAEQFEEARRIYLETSAALGFEDEDPR